MAVAILIDVILGDGLTPSCTTLEFDVFDVDTSIDDVDIDTLATLWLVDIPGEGTESQFVAMADSCKTLKIRKRETKSVQAKWKLSAVTTPQCSHWGG
jgi:hypothetical protein